jgi:alpha-tubulin suppressor-like RCC1 family protein
VELLVTDTVQLVVQVLDAQGRVVTTDLEWQVDPPSALTIVGGAGQTTVVRSDSITVTASTTGDGSVRVRVPADGPVSGQELAISVPIRMKWRSVDAGAAHACGVTWDGRAHCWGSLNEVIFGAFLGDGSSSGTDRPAEVAGALTFTAVSAGANHACGLIRGGTVYCWGANTFGAVGNGTSADQLSPVAVFQGPSWSSVSAGPMFTCGVAANPASGVCFGRADDGQLGSTVGLETCDGRACRTVPQGILISGTPPANVASIGAGTAVMCVALADGAAYCWGDNARGMLGNPAVAQSDTAVAVSGATDFAAVSVGSHHACGLSAAGVARCWGTNRFGELGSGALDLGSSCDGLDCNPIPLEVSGGELFTSISVGGRSTCALTGDGRVFCWGWNRFGQLSATSSETCNGESCSTTPLEIEGLTLVSVSVGEGFACGLAPGGAAYCWGRGEYGQHGDGDLADSTEPVRVIDP